MKPEKKVSKSKKEITDIDTIYGLKFSSTVMHVARSFGEKDEVLALSIIYDILKIHDEYAKGKAMTLILDIGEDFSMGNPQGKRMTIKKWLHEVRLLFDEEKAPELHGRHVIIGLSLLEENISKQLYKDDFLITLVDEINQQEQEPLESLLTPKGRNLWDMLGITRPHIVSAHSVPTHPDHPTEEDLLGRKYLAKWLAARLNYIYKDCKSNFTGAFLVHIHGPWGSGKTSFLNFLRQSLNDKTQRDPSLGDKSSRWVVVNFNAWQHQRLGPPWWSLMDATYREAYRQLGTRRAIKLWFQEWCWRLSTGKLHQYLLIALFFWILALLIWFFPPDFNNSPKLLSTLADNAKSLSAVIALIATVWGSAHGISSSLVSGSVRSARTFINSTRDPLESLRNHFEDIVNWVQQPIVIFIDDLDRCKGNYAVELLEGIQTLFKESNIIYVVAADRRWLHTSFEKEYDAFTNAVKEPGRPLGHLFLEKTFQLSVSLPRLSDERKEQYWQYLIRIGQLKNQKKELEQAQIDAKQRIQSLRTEEDILAELKGETNNPIYDRALREAAIIQLAEPDVMAHTEEHILKDFYLLMELNPRAMKRFVNAYGAALAIYLSDEKRSVSNFEPKKLALWTIILLRWPLLADYLENHPEMINNIGTENLLIDTIPQDLRELFTNPEVRNVIEGKGVGVLLDEKAISSFAGLRTTDTSTSVVA